MKNILKTVSVDGLPQVGKPFLAYDKIRKECNIFRRADKEWIRKQNWGNEEDHISPDGEFYSGKHDWIYSISFDSYIYIDTLNEIGLKPKEEKK